MARTAGIAAACLGLSLLLVAQTPPQPSPQQSQTQPKQPQQNPPGTTPLPPMQLDADATLHHLNQVVRWYRNSTTGSPSVGLPSDTMYQDNTQNLGQQAVRLAFQSAKAEAALIGAQPKSAGSAVGAQQTSQAQTLAQLEAKDSAQISDLQTQIDNLNSQIAKASGTHRGNLLSQRGALESELELQKARLEAIQKMASFVESNGEISGGLEGEINQLARSIPEVTGSAAAGTKTATAPVTAKPSLANSGGLISEAITLYDHVRAARQIDSLIEETGYTRDLADRLRSPLRDALKATIQQSQTLANQATADPQQLQAEQQNFKQLTDHFKQLSGALIPLSQEIIVLDDSKANFNEWRSSISRDSKYVLRSLLVRVVSIALALALVLILSEVWRRVTFRYIADPRRRRQFLVLRRVLTGFLIAIVLTLGFVTQFSSLATFAGFITAGIAVGLQAVLLSVAAYFFIIGRYGIRVGDRISVAGITGDVVDIGLVRFYLIELAGTGLDFYPTGRIVVFSNAVLFQAGTPLFKQIPGTEYTWHEVVVLITANGDHKEAEEKLVAAVNSVYSEYREEIERQHSAIERRVDIQIDAPRPEARLQFADAGLELLVRYPVEIRKAPDIDEEMTRKVLQLIESDPSLKTAVAGNPKIRSAVKG